MCCFTPITKHISKPNFYYKSYQLLSIEPTLKMESNHRNSVGWDSSTDEYPDATDLPPPYPPPTYLEAISDAPPDPPPTYQEVMLDPIPNYPFAESRHMEVDIKCMLLESDCRVDLALRKETIMNIDVAEEQHLIYLTSIYPVFHPVVIDYLMAYYAHIWRRSDHFSGRGFVNRGDPFHGIFSFLYPRQSSVNPWTRYIQGRYREREMRRHTERL